MLDVRRRSRGQESGAESQPRGVAAGRRTLTGGLGSAETAGDGWTAWGQSREEIGVAGQGSFLGVDRDESGRRARLRLGGELPLTREGLRRELEAMWAGGGRVRAQTWLLQMDVLSRDERRPEVEAALAMARVEIEALSAAEDDFQARLVRTGRTVAGEMLAGSEARVRESLAAYGIELGPVLEKAIEREGRTAAEIGLDVLDNPLEPLGQAMVASNPALHAGGDEETASRTDLAAAVHDLRARAAELAEANGENDRLEIEVQRRRGGVCQTSHHGARAGGPDFSYLAAFPGPELTFGGRPVPVSDEPGLDVEATGSALRVERLTAELQAAWRGYEARHPVLAAYRDRGGYPTEELGRLAGGRDEMHRELVRVSFERLCAIAKARQALDSGAVSVLELPRVVKQTRARLGVEPGSLEGAFIDNAVADASDPDWLTWVVTALSFASAILLTPATAGSSAALVLDLGFFTADLWLAIDAAAEHSFAAAAALTDYAPDRALGDDERSAASLISAVAAAGASLLPFLAGARAANSSSGVEGHLEASLVAGLDDVEPGASRFAFGSLGDEATSPALGSPKAGIASHLEQFRGGASQLLPESSYKQFVAGAAALGRPDGVFMSTRSAIDDLLAASGGNLAMIKKRLGIKPREWNERLWRVDVANPLLHNARLPNGMEEGANSLFIWGGYTRGGMVEAVLDPVPRGGFVAYPTEVKP